MVSSKHLLRLIRLLATLVSGTVCLGAVMLSLRALSVTADTTNADPQFRAVTVEAVLPIHDTAPRQGVSRTVYFNNFKASGALTLTFDISGTLPFTLTASPGFDQDMERVYPSDESPWTREITYSVDASHGDQDLAFTVSNTNGVAALVLTFVRDITAPEVIIGTPSQEISLSTGSSFVITGAATDSGGSGVEAVTVTVGVTSELASLTLPGWSVTWTVPSADFFGYPVTATVHDAIGNLGEPSAGVVITVDNQAPTAGQVFDAGTWSLTSTLTFTWTTSTDRAGIDGYYVLITHTGGTVVDNAFTDESIYNLIGASEGMAYYGRVKAQDRVGNVGHYGPASDGITPDLSGPYTGSVTISSGVEFISSTTVVLTLRSDDAGSGVTEMCLSNTDGCTGVWEPYTNSKAGWTLSDLDGLKTVYVWFRDQVLNTSGPYTDTVFLDRQPPIVHVTVTRQGKEHFLVDWSDSTDPAPGSGIVAYEVYTRTNDGPWTPWLPSTTVTQSVFVAPGLGVTYTFSVTTFDRAGNQRQDSISIFASGLEPRQYLPVVMRNYRPFVNGDFEQGGFGWDFVDHGLPARLISSYVEGSGSEQIPTGNYSVLLGRTDYACSSTGVPLGYAAVEQTFKVPSTTVPISLTFKYVVYTQDASPSELYDRFEVYVVTTATESTRFADGNQVSTNLSCDKLRRVPGPENPRQGNQSGWATGVVDLGPFKGQMIKISFRNYSRFDGWYNTYTYLDNVRLATGP